MTERAEPPMTFGGTGGLVWRLRPDDGALATTRRSRPDPSAPDALRPPALGPPTRLASCGRRWDTALSPERVELAAALASRVADRALASAASAPRSRVRDAVPDPADVPSDADSDSDSDSDSDDARPDYRLDYETFEARAALLRGHPPVGVPRRVLRRGVAESHAASLRPAPCAFANALAVAPWPGRGLDEGGDLILAHTGGENAVELRVTRLSLAHPTRDASTRPAVRALGTWRVPTRAAAQPVLQIELATLPNGSGWFGGEDHAPPALCATRDRHGAALCAVGGGAREPAPRGRDAPGRRDAALAARRTRAPEGTLLWSFAPVDPRDAPADIALNPHGVPEMLVASANGALRRVDASGGFGAGGARATGERPGDWDGDGWSGCAYAAHPRVALSATPQEVRLVDFRARGRGAGDVIATRDATRRPWRAMAGPPPPPWSPVAAVWWGDDRASPRHLARRDDDDDDTRANDVRARASEYAFALACDETVELRDLRRPATPAATWRHGFDDAPAWLRVVPTAGWRGTRPRATEMEGVVGESVVGAREIHREVHPGSSSREVHPGSSSRWSSRGSVFAGAASGGGVVGYEFADDGDAVRALSAGTRVPTISGRDGDDVAGMAIIPPLARGRARPGAVVWSSTRGDVVARARAALEGADEDAARTPIVFDESNANDAADGDGVSRRDDDEGRTRVGRRRRENAGSDDETLGTKTSGDVFADATKNRRLVSEEDARALGAAEGVVSMPRGSVVYGEATARAAAEGAERAAEAEGAERFAEPAREDAATRTRATRAPMLYAFVANGSSPAFASRGETNAETATSSATSSATSAARLVRARGEGWPLTSHELARAAAAARGEVVGDAMVDWRASVTAAGKPRQKKTQKQQGVHRVGGAGSVQGIDDDEGDEGDDDDATTLVYARSTAPTGTRAGARARRRRGRRRASRRHTRVLAGPRVRRVRRVARQLVGRVRAVDARGPDGGGGDVGVGAVVGAADGGPGDGGEHRRGETRGGGASRAMGGVIPRG